MFGIDRDKLHTDLKNIAIILGGIWFLAKYVWPDIDASPSTSIHLSPSVKLSEAGRKDGYVAIKADFNVTNSSDRSVYLLSNAILFTSHSLCFRSEPVCFDGKAVSEADVVPEKVVLENDSITSLNVIGINSDRFAVGQLFRDIKLEPKESISRTVIMYADEKLSDYVEVRAVFPYTIKPNSLEVKWASLDLNDAPHPEIYRIDGSQRRVLLDIDKSREDRDYLDGQGYTRLEIAEMLSLWHKTGN